MTTQVSYAADGASVAFPFPFAITVAADCQVLIDGILQTSGFGVRGQGGIDGGAVVFDSAPASGQTITLRYRGDTTITALDGQPGQLADKLEAGANISLETVTASGGGQSLRITGACVGGHRHAQAFNANGTFVVPDGVTAVCVEVFGAGGGSRTLDSDGRTAFGAGGGYSLKMISGLIPGQSIAVTVGAGGAGAGDSSASAGDGGASSFGEHVVATGGAGSFMVAEMAKPGGTAGSGVGGDINVTGSLGGYVIGGGVAGGGFNGGFPGGAGGDGPTSDGTGAAGTVRVFW